LAQNQGASKPATLKVLVPDEDVELTVGTSVTEQKGKERLFGSPPLKPGVNYYYTVEMVWKPNNYTTITRRRDARVRAGELTVLDLRDKDPKQPDDIVIRFVPTPQEVVEAMLKLGEVGPGDVVYDLGCGDGRIVVTAVQKFGAKRGVGVDIDPERIQDSKETAAKAKVTDKVEFRQADVLKIKDYSDATVVMLYMGDALNLALRPILEETLKPGTRIVSHRFTMGDWKPEKTITVKDEDGEEYDLHLWRIKGK
jgi:uncharacterized protein (TIGR03000 family)